MPSKLREDLPKQVVYVIWSQTRDRVYVGSSMNFPGRYNDHAVVLGLGGTIEILHDMEGKTKAEVLDKEDEVLLGFRARGILVINRTNHEIRQARGRAAMAGRSKEELRAQQLRATEARRNLPAERQSQIMKGAWVTRRETQA